MSELSMSYGQKESGVISRWLLNPFYYVAGGKALTLGVVIMVATGSLAFLGRVRFDGILDFHLGPPAPSLGINISEIMVSWLFMSFFLLILGKIFSKSRVRSIDVFGTQALARSPLFLVSLIALLPGAGRFARNNLADPAVWRVFSFDMAAFIFLTLFGIMMIIWMVLLMYRSFSVSCNVSGKSAKLLFVASLIIGELLSVIVIRHGLAAVQTQTADITIRAAEFVTLLSGKDYEAAVKMFDDTMASALPAEKLEDVWQSLVLHAGPFLAQGDARQERISGYDVCFVPCRFEHAAFNAQIAFDREAKISGLYFRPSSGE
ncbi:DUF3887 domain-containing protein [uncultured Desulfobacter sp.]|uniref:DUF3887 domain-containing protein n=1 Tax=uncultured Desulfobacter sp. TaxID=240139 RepID=UPI002AAAEF53|nr:DUF3887 domain-containing protein [uncultured Desulfobacter sp.]